MPRCSPHIRTVLKQGWQELPEARCYGFVCEGQGKACGVTFAVSAIERVIEERAKGVPGRARALREELAAKIGTDIKSVVPGSPEAARLKDALIAEGLWSQYLEVAIGPDAEVFTKAPPLSAVGWGDLIGVRSQSTWNNPEPEVVVVADRKDRTLPGSHRPVVRMRFLGWVVSLSVLITPRALSAAVADQAWEPL